MSMLVLNGNQLPTECEEVEKVRVSKCIMHYYWSNDNLMFKNLVVPRPNEHQQLILDLHQKIGHFGKGGTLARDWAFWKRKDIGRRLGILEKEGHWKRSTSVISNTIEVVRSYK